MIRKSLLLRWVMKLQRQLSLEEWRVILHDDPPENPLAVAECRFPDSGAAEVWLAIGPRFWQSTPEYQRETMIHELLHILLHDLSEAAEDLSWTDLIPRGMDELHRRNVRRAEERAVDRLARVIAEDFLLPPHTEKGWTNGTESGFGID